MFNKIEEKLNKLTPIKPNITTTRQTKTIDIKGITKNINGITYIENESDFSSKKKRNYNTKKEAPKIFSEELVFKDYYIYLQDNDTKLKDFAREFIRLQDDKSRKLLLQNNPEIEKRYYNSIDRFINLKKKIELEQKLEEFKKECIYLFESNVDDKFKDAIESIHLFKNANRKTATIKKNYIVAVKELTELQKKTRIKILDLFEINSPIEDIITGDLFIDSINNQIIEITKLRNEINKEIIYINSTVSSAKDLARKTKDSIINNLLDYPQIGKFKEMNWSKLDNDSKKDRVYSFIYSKLISQVWTLFHESNIITCFTLSKEITDKVYHLANILTDDITKLIISKDIKYNQITWKKHDGILVKINSETPIEITDDIKELVE